MIACMGCASIVAAIVATLGVIFIGAFAKAREIIKKNKGTKR